MSTGYEGGFTRRQELTCTETEMAAYADVVLYANEHIYIKMNSGMIRLKIGDGKTGLLNLPWAKVFDATLDDVEAIVGGFASRVETNTKRIENLEAAVSPEIVTPVTDSTMAYAKTVPKGALPNAAITEIGGMSYVKNGVLVDSKVEAIESVGANLISFPYNSNEEKINGVNWTVNPDGTVVANGTADGGNSAFYLTDDLMLSAGNYVISGVPASAGYNATVTMYCVDDEGQLISIKTNSGEYSYVNAFGDGALAITIPRRAKATIYTQVIKGSTCSNLVFKPMLNRGSTALPYTLYFRETLPIPGDALDGWGQGVSKERCNKIVLDPLEGVKKYVKNVSVVDLGTLNWSIEESRYAFSTVAVALKNSAVVYSRLPTSITNIYVNNYGNIVINFETGAFASSSALKTALSGVIVAYELATPVETDVSHLFTDDNLLRVVPGGTITAANEFEHEVPFTVEYMIKGA